MCKYNVLGECFHTFCRLLVSDCKNIKLIIRERFSHDEVRRFLWLSKLAGTPVQEQDIIDVQTLVDAYFDNAPDITDPTQLVSFGTSGHRGTSLNGTFTDLHVAVITQAICDGCGQFGATGPLFVGQDTHALSQPALITVLEVLAGNGVTAMVDADMDFVPTPSVSRAIIRYNESHDHKADGIVITPSHNPSR